MQNGDTTVQYMKNFPLENFPFMILYIATLSSLLQCVLEAHTKANLSLMNSMT